MTEIDFSKYVEVIQDWPEPGNAVCDISRLLEHPTVFHHAVAALAKPFLDVQPNKVIGIEQRGLARIRVSHQSHFYVPVFRHRSALGD